MYFTVLTKKKILSILAIFIVSVILTGVLCSTGAHQVFFGYAVRELPIYRVQTDQKKLAISFDCAWGVDYTDELLEIMRSEDVKCTFFMVEFWAKKYPEYVKKIDQAGHEIGTHSATHPYMSKLNKNGIERELTTSKRAIEEITGKTVEVFRPPYGDYNDLLIRTARDLGLYTIQWDVDSLDWKNLSASEIHNRVVSKVQPGSIVLFHNQGLNTAKALKDIITALKEKGFAFVSIGELIYKNNYKMLADGTQIQNS